MRIKFILIFLILFFTVNSYAKQKEKLTHKELEEKILNMNDREFKKVILKILQDGGISNDRIIIDTQKLLRDKSQKKATPEKKVFGLANIEKYGGFEIAKNGIIIVFGGLILIAFVVYLFNKVFAEKAYTTADVNRRDDIYEEVEKATLQSIPEEDLIAIATALELYKRLYIDSMQSKLTFTEKVSSWQTGNAFSHRTNRRGY